MALKSLVRHWQSLYYLIRSSSTSSFPMLVLDLLAPHLIIKPMDDLGYMPQQAYPKPYVGTMFEESANHNCQASRDAWI
jgi:hypothetical protein